MSWRDYYYILKLTRNASASKIKSAYRRLAIECHPDHHPEDPEAEEKFKQISEAYSVLGDAQKRRDYDLLHHSRSTMPDIDERDDKSMGSRYQHTRRGNRRSRTPNNFAQNTILGVRLGQILEILLAPEEARLGTERFVLITAGRRRQGYHVRIPGGVSQGTQFKAILGRDENRYILIRTTILKPAHHNYKI